jgi:hypothetical protein
MAVVAAHTRARAYTKQVVGILAFTVLINDLFGGALYSKKVPRVRAVSCLTPHGEPNPVGGGGGHDLKSTVMVLSKRSATPSPDVLASSGKPCADHPEVLPQPEQGH